MGNVIRNQTKTNKLGGLRGENGESNKKPKGFEKIQEISRVECKLKHESHPLTPTHGGVKISKGDTKQKKLGGM